MPDNELDPGATTQMFQAFVDREEPEPDSPAWVRFAVVAVAVVALLIAVAVGWSLLAG
jgi:hypothetical protein